MLTQRLHFTTAPAGPRPFGFVLYGDKRSFPERREAIAQLIKKETTVQYVITGGGGAQLHSFRKASWDGLALSIHHICTVAVNRQHLSFKAIGSTGRCSTRSNSKRDARPARIAYAEDVTKDEDLPASLGRGSLKRLLRRTQMVSSPEGKAVGKDRAEGSGRESLAPVSGMTSNALLNNFSEQAWRQE